jgi:nucleoside-specific outer membrane channel protein Tsx
MKYIILLVVLFALQLKAFESSNIQLLHSNSFNGNSFVYDTQDGKKTTLTFEHFRTFSLGDFFMFVDVTDGKKFDNRDTDIYAEFAPRLSFSKMLDQDLSIGVIKDISIATQMEKAFDNGDHYRAYLYGLGFDFTVPMFNVFTINVYNKNDSINSDDTYQVTAVYISPEFNGWYFEGFIDKTKRDFSTQNQVLYNLDNFLNINEKIYIGVEWLYYDYDYRGSHSKTSAVQGMVKYSF